MSESSRHILVLGAGGFLGAAVARAVVGTDAPVTLHVRSRSSTVSAGAPVVEADLCDPEAIDGLLGAVRPDLIVNCAALADVDACERDPDLADALNRRLPERLAAWTVDAGAQLIHVSTDAVFDGRSGPYGTDAIPSPINGYGRSKRAGELAVLATDPTALVARTNIVGWSPSGTRSLLEYFLGRLSRGQVAPGFHDIHFRPLPVHWFWPACRRFLDAATYGLIHLTGPELLSKYAFGLRVAHVFGLDATLVVPTASPDAALVAPRPPRLDVLPSTLDGEVPLPGGLDRGLRELRAMRDAVEAEA